MDRKLDDAGATATEYALVAGLVTAVVVFGVSALGLTTFDLFSRLGW